MERAEAATKVAELARAAEAIERAAAAERELGRAAEQAAANPGQPQPDAAAVKAEQQHVAAVAEKVAEAIKNTAPEAAAAIEKAKPPIAENRPVEAAEALAKAASEIRREAAETAMELARVQESRLEQATREQEAMAAAKEPPSPEEAADQAARVAELARVKQLADKLASDMAAQQKARDAIAERGENGEATAESTSPAGKPEPHPGESVSQAGKKPDRSQAARQGEAKSDGPLEPMDRVDKNADVAGTRAGDANQAAKSLEQESWFAKLPPEMRQAIRAKSQRRAPRGYEEKLDRYFRNID